VSDITLVPESFTLVKFDADEVVALIAATAREVGFPDDVALRVEIDEVLPHPLTASTVDVAEDGAHLWFTGGCFESPKRQTGLSVDNTRVELASAMLRARDRLSGGFEDAPVDDELDDRTRNLWEAYAEARARALGFPVREQRRRYTFRLACGFNDVADAEFDRLWSGGTLDWATTVATAQHLAAVDTRPERKKSLRRESLRAAASPS
jgi:hypothetical protein